MERKRGLKNLFKNNFISLVFLIILISLGVVFAGDIIVKEGDMSVDGDQNVTGAGYFDFLGSLTNKIKTLFVQEINFNGTINGTGPIITTGKIKSGQQEIENDEYAPLFIFDQNNATAPFGNYQGTKTATVGANSISTGDGSGAVTAPHLAVDEYDVGWRFVGMVKIKINALEYWMPYYDIDESEPE